MAELIRDPARSDRLIAQAAGCEHSTVCRLRRELEGQHIIEPATRRTPRPAPPREPGRARLAIEAGATTSREVMDMTGVTRSMACAALKRYGRPPAAVRAQDDAAAAIDTLSVERHIPVRWAKIRACAPAPPSSFPAYATGWERATPAALNVCLNWCPALAQCRKWAMSQPPADTRVYAGLTPQQRRAASLRPNGSVP